MNGPIAVYVGKALNQPKCPSPQRHAFSDISKVGQPTAAPPVLENVRKTIKPGDSQG
jgi:hypothetical protein